MSFNAQAVLCHSPWNYDVTLPNQFRLPQMVQGVATVSANRKLTSGRYDLYESGTRAVSELAAQRGIVARSHTYSQEEICKLLFAVGAEFKPNLNTLNEQYCAFLRSQVEALGSPAGPALQYVTARQDFERVADLLLVKMKNEIFSKFVIKTVSNPLQARALAQRREGVFVWPDWRDERYVNVVMSCSSADHTQVRDMVLDWSEENKLRLNPRFSF